jgi:hypothetical protein
MKRKITILRYVGSLLFWCGAVFAIASLSLGLSGERIPEEAEAARMRTAEIMAALQSTGLSGSQKTDVSKAVRCLVTDSQVNRDFLIVSFLFLSSCIVALLGQVTMLWARTIALTERKSQPSSPPYSESAPSASSETVT